MEDNFSLIAKNAKVASKKIAVLSTEIKNEALIKIAQNISDNKNKIFEANKIDLEEAKPLVEKGELTQSTYNRLKLDENKIRVGRDLFERGVCLPSDVNMTKEEQERIIRIIT